MLIAMCSFDSPENNRFDCTRQTVDSLKLQVDLARHRIFFVDNNSTDPRTLALLKECESWATVIYNETNLGTARAINKAWKHRQPGQHCAKIDNDVTVSQKDWPDLMEEVFRRMPSAGIVGLKRNDLEQRPNHPDTNYESHLIMLDKTPDKPWIVVEQCEDIMGTCTGFNSHLLDCIGYLYQMQDHGGAYGYDDVQASHRSIIAGFKNVFIPYVQIAHVDNMEKKYMAWKHNVSGTMTAMHDKVVAEFRSGKRPLYWEDK